MKAPQDRPGRPKNQRRVWPSGFRFIAVIRTLHPDTSRNLNGLPLLTVTLLSHANSFTSTSYICTQKQNISRELLNTENDHLKKLNEIVLQSIEQEKLLLESINEKKDEQLSFGQRPAEQGSPFWRQLEIYFLVCDHPRLFG